MRVRGSPASLSCALLVGLGTSLVGVSDLTPIEELFFDRISQSAQLAAATAKSAGLRERGPVSL